MHIECIEDSFLLLPKACHESVPVSGPYRKRISIPSANRDQIPPGELFSIPNDIRICQVGFKNGIF